MCQRLPPSELPLRLHKGWNLPSILLHPLYFCGMSCPEVSKCVYKCKLTTLIITSIHRDGSFKYHRNLPIWPTQVTREVLCITWKWIVKVWTCLAASNRSKFVASVASPTGRMDHRLYSLQQGSYQLAFPLPHQVLTCLETQPQPSSFLSYLLQKLSEDRTWPFLKVFCESL